MYQLLIVGKNEEITETVARLLEKYDKIVTERAHDLKSVQAALDTKMFDVIMNCGGFSKDEEDHLVNMGKENNPSIRVIEHFGGGSGLLLSELKETLDL